eukprot:m.490133 g.490133  ORF g.490133 m.490133 type:complete len:617 (+) comp57246_c0_seq2:97-1947(+)
MAVRSKQITGLQTVLAPADPTNPQWKVLVYDNAGRDILSPILSQAALRDLSVVAHFSISAVRTRIPDAPAVYFVMPTEANIRRICQDCESDLYGSFELNFISELPRKLLELLAATAATAEADPPIIAKVFDVYSNFISLEENLFVMSQQQRSLMSYGALNNPGAQDTEIEQMMKDIVDSLFSVLVTMSVVPIIRCSRRNAAEDIARRLDQKLRDNLANSKTSLFANSLDGLAHIQRPVLVLLDRNIDLSVIMHHTWTYQALVHDLLDLKLNRVTLRETNPAGNTVEKNLDLDKADRFWGSNRGKPFPTVAGAVEEDIQTFKAKEAELRKLKGGDDDDEVAEAEASVAIAENTARIASAVASLPELLAQKRFLDLHTTILTAVMDGIKQRQLDSFYETEDELLTKKAPSRPLVELLAASCPATLDDKLRLLVIFYLTSEQSDDEIAPLEATLREQGADTASLKYLRTLKQFQQLGQPSVAAKAKGSASTLASKLLQTGNHLWKQGVKALQPTTKDLPVTKIVESLMDLKPIPQTEDYLYFDPRLVKSSGTTEVPKGRAPFENGIVFMIGGGNYIEYQNLCDYVERGGNRKTIVYGATDLVSASELLVDLTALGKSTP